MIAYNLNLIIFTPSVIIGSTYSQKAYPLDTPVTASFTRLKAFNGPNEVNNSLTYLIFHFFK